MPITPTSPIVIPEKTFDKLWLSEMIVRSPKIAAGLPNPDASASLVLTPYNSTTLEANRAATVTIQVPNIFARIGRADAALGDVKLAQILGLILQYAEEEAKRQEFI